MIPTIIFDYTVFKYTFPCFLTVVMYRLSLRSLTSHYAGRHGAVSSMLKKGVLFVDNSHHGSCCSQVVFRGTCTLLYY